MTRLPALPTAAVGSGGGSKGPVDVEVKVIRYKENWFLASLDYVPKKIVEEQDIAGAGAVTGATTTSRAILNATANALKSAAS